MNDLTVSIVIVSRGRPNALTRCLTGLSQLQYAPFEVIVVSNQEGLEAARLLLFSDALKLLEFDQPNISAARNLGINAAAGEVVAFIDDDAVPEPQWLRNLVAPASQSDVSAMGGFVRGRNGISFQWKARMLDPLGEAHDILLDPETATVLTPPKGRAVKTEGTNMAVRRSVLVEMGGFDPAFHYFLDETDLNMRLARAGHATAIVPSAEVHHGFAANTMRTQTRVPRDLFDIGASRAVFQRKHVPAEERTDQWHRLRTSERQRLVSHMVGGGLEPRDIRRLMHRLDQGFAEGQSRPLATGQISTHPAQAFLPFPSKERKSVLIPTRPLHAAKDRAIAVERVESGQIVTLLNLSPTAVYHQLSFEMDGIWLQKGGIYGRSDRIRSLFQPMTRFRRVQMERERVALQRGLSEE